MAKDKELQTIIVVTRITDDHVVATYINFEGISKPPYIMGVGMHGPHSPVGVELSEIPAAIGGTKTLVHYKEPDDDDDGA